MRVLIVSSPVAPLGDGRTGGITRQLETMCQALTLKGASFEILAPVGSQLSSFQTAIRDIAGTFQPSLAATDNGSHYPIPQDGVLAEMWRQAFQDQSRHDVIVNVAQDWLPYYVGDFFQGPVLHMVNMGDVDPTTGAEIVRCARAKPGRVAFLSQTQAKQFDGLTRPTILPLGLDLANYRFVETPGEGLIWGGRISPEKGLEDALEIAKRCGETLAIAGSIDDHVYWDGLQRSYGPQIDYRGFMTQNAFQSFLGQGRVLLQTQKWQEAFGLVTLEALACGTPVIAYARGANTELISNGITGFLIDPDNIDQAVAKRREVHALDRAACRAQAESEYSLSAFADRLDVWLSQAQGDPIR